MQISVTCMAVVLIMKMQYWYKLLLWWSATDILGFWKFKFTQTDVFGRYNGTTPPCWSRGGNRVKFGLTALGWDCGSLSAIYFTIHSYIYEQAMGYFLVGRLTRLKTLVCEINAAEYMFIKVYIKHNRDLNPVVPLAVHCFYTIRFCFIIARKKWYFPLANRFSYKLKLT